MEIIFIRHSKTEVYPQVPIPLWGLSQKGVILAQKLAQKDVIKSLSVIFTSSQTKALETALILAKPNAIPIKVKEELTEITSFTHKYETDIHTYEQNLKAYYLGRIERINKGETQKEALTRFNRAVEAVVAESAGKKVGIVSHGHILTLYAAQYQDIDPFVTHTAINQPDISIFHWEKKEFTTFFGEDI